MLETLTRGKDFEDNDDRNIIDKGGKGNFESSNEEKLTQTKE